MRDVAQFEPPGCALAGAVPDHAAQRIQAIDVVAGRYRWIRIGPHTLRLLAKNPAGWHALPV